MQKIMGLLLVFTLTGSVSANFNWVGSGGDDYFNNPANWLDDGGTASYYIANGDVTILVDAAHPATAGGGARLGDTSGLVTVNITGGSLTSAQTRLGYRDNGACEVNVSGDGLFINETYIRSAYSDTSTNSWLNIMDNGKVTVGTYWRHAEKGHGYITVEDNGMLEVAQYLDLADSSGDGVLTVKDDGSVVVIGRLDVGAQVGSASGTAVVNLLDGTVRAGSLAMNNKGIIDIEMGELLLAGDLREDATLSGYIDNKYMIGYGDDGDIVIGDNLVNIEGSNYTSITAIPEPASIILMGLGGLAYFRRK